ncbi:inactive pancreatic lipase-related protein 1-like [Eleutherodactylus coqui]|uniref:inactive pancreatic lipase-related protein 1-like n=1 Tax=Eleutherodactylus coqui TaxID=57060 RepID=UPI0034632C76
MMLSGVMIVSLLGAAGGWMISFAPDESYSSSYPWSGTPGRPFSTVPIPIPIRWFLITKDRPPQEIYFNNASHFSSCGFDFTKRTCVIIHGYTQSAMEPWINNMCQELTTHQNVNCVALDWSSGSLTFYAQAVSILRYVGRQLARALSFLELVHNYPAFNVHLIGHSLGCHIAAYAGKCQRNVDRITALDPARPFFEGEAEVVRLTSRDARFVDVIHSNAKDLLQLGLGYISPIGDVDFYPNGGQNMPECPDVSSIQNTVLCLLSTMAGPLNCSESFQAKFVGCEELLKDVILTFEELKEKLYEGFCSHFQSILYFTNSIGDSKKYAACPCDPVGNCLQGIPEPCAEEERRHMGYHARPPSSSEPQTFTLSTT